MNNKASPQSGRQPLRYRALRGLQKFVLILTWGLRPRLYAFARFAGFDAGRLCFRPFRGLGS